MTKPAHVSLLAATLLALEVALPAASAAPAAGEHAPITLAASAFGHRGGPTRLVASGGLVLPAGLPAGQACHGVVSVRARQGRATLATARTVLRGICTYRASLLVTAARVRGTRPLRLVARFEGDALLAPAVSRPLFVPLP